MVLPEAAGAVTDRRRVDRCRRARSPDGASRAPATEPAELAQFSDPFAVAVTRGGRVHVADGGDSNRIRAIDGGRVFTVAGGRGEGFDDGPGRDARFHTPSGIAVADDGAVYVADTGNHRIRRISADGHVTTVAGTGIPGLRDGTGREAQFNGPIGIAIAAGRPACRPAPAWLDRILPWFRALRSERAGGQPGRPSDRCGHLQ